MTDPAPSAAPAGWYPDPSTGQQRWWDGRAWGGFQSPPPPVVPQTPPQAAPQQAYQQPYQQQTFQPPAYTTSAFQPAAGNGLAVAALVLGIAGFFTTGIPLFIGLFLGGPMDLAAIVLGILGINRSRTNGGRGFGMALTGIIFGGIAVISIFFGAGTIW